jgi:hypothetical protein
MMMLRKSLSLFSLSAFLTFSFFVFTSISYAQDEGISVEEDRSLIAPDYYPPYPRPEPGFLGQDHSYTVVFRGNGEAVVSAKIVFTNKSEENLSKINLRIPRVEPSQLSVYQVIRERQCIRYKQPVYDSISRSYGPQVCEEYGDIDHYTGYGKSKYLKAESEMDIDTINIVLPKAVAPNASGSFFIYYRAMGYATKNVFGAFEYVFESLKADDDVRSLRVGISTDSDLVLRGATGEVEYRFEEPALKSLDSAAVGVAQESVSIDRYVNQIGQGRITKTASNLAPLESYTVEGAYAKSVSRLYGREIAITLAVILLAIVLTVVLIRFIWRRLKGKVAQAEEEQPIASGISANTKNVLIVAGVSFASSLLILGYTIAVFVIGSLFSNLISYQYQFIFRIFLMIISFVIYSLLLFTPGIYVGVKKGVGWGIGLIVLTVIWLIMFLGIAILIIFLFGVSRLPGPITPLPLMESVTR